MTRTAVLGCLSLASLGWAAPPPKILGVAHFGIYVKDLAKARQFYEQLLGFEELPGKTIVKVNDFQSIELFTGKDLGQGQLHDIAFSVDNAGRMRAFLKTRGIAAQGLTIQDPDGHAVEFIERRAPAGAGKFLPATRISDHIMHVGILVGDLEKSIAFYHGALGFNEFWRGSSTSRVLSWVNMRVPGGQDYVEFMLYDKLPDADKRGSQHHASLTIPDAARALEELKKRAARIGYDRDIVIRTGVNRKRQINLYDPDGTRIELMEPDTIDGKPAPSSTAPPPH